MRACRTCLSKYDLCPLFGENEFNSDQLYLSTGVRMAPDDGLPQTVCRSCFKTITKSLHLRELSLKAEEFLKTIAEHNVKTEPEIQDMTESLIDPFSIENHQNSHIFIQQNEETNYMNELNDNDYGNYVPSDDDTKPVIRNDDMKVNGDDFDIDNEHTYKTEFVNIQTKQEHVYDTDNERKTINCITLSKDAQIMLYPTKDAGHNSKTLNITKEPEENLLQNPTLALCQSLKSNQQPKPIKDPTNVKYIIKSNAHNVQNCKSEIFQSILKNKLQNDSANVFSHEADVSGQTATTSAQISNTSDQISKVRIEDFISSKELNELFKDARKFGKKVNTCQTANVSGETFDISSQIENTKDLTKKELHKLFKDRKLFNDDEVKTVKRLNITDPSGLQIPEDDQDHENLFGNLMSNLKNNLPKYIPNDTKECSVIKNKYNIKKPKKMDLNRRKYFLERNKELMSLAVVPYKDSGPIQCSVCYELARNKQRFRSHALKHFDKQHVCQYAGCEKKFVHRSQLSRHQQCMHGVEKKFSCGQCSFRAVDRPTIQNHIRAEHTGEKPFECNECGARFRMRNNIIQHMIVHFRPTKSVQCEFCPSRFQCRRDLWIHQDKTHFYTYNYHCYLCPNIYKGGCSVRKHLLKVHGVPKDQQLKIRRDKIKKTDAPSSSNVKPIVSNTPR